MVSPLYVSAGPGPRKHLGFKAGVRANGGHREPPGDGRESALVTAGPAGTRTGGLVAAPQGRRGPSGRSWWGEGCCGWGSGGEGAVAPEHTHAYSYLHPHVPKHEGSGEASSRRTDRAGGKYKEVGKGQRGEGSDLPGCTAHLREGCRGALKGAAPCTRRRRAPLPRLGAPPGGGRRPGSGGERGCSTRGS